MSVGLLIITHNNIGKDIVATAETILRKNPLNTKVIAVKSDADPEAQYKLAEKHLATLDQGHGVLVLTDLYGATPSNIASRLADKHNVRVVTGLNLPMVLRIMNYPGLSLDKMTAKAISVNRDSIFEYKP